MRVVVLLLLIGFSPLVLGHGGGLNKDGCHTNRKTGDYHCHRGSGQVESAYARKVRDAVSKAKLRAEGYRSRTGPRLRADFKEARQGGMRAVESIRHFANCSEARALGAAPVRRGEPGYARHLDRDNDGVGCE